MHPHKNQRVRSSGLVTVMTLLIAGTLSGCSKEESAPPQSAAMQMRAASVNVIEVQPQSVQSVRELTGRARAYAEAEIRPQVTGLIQKRLFTEGQQVEAGQALYQIDSSEYRAAVDSAAAAVKGSEATAAAARETAKRFKRLAEINAVSQQDYEEAEASSQQAEAQIGINRASLSTARINLDRTKVSSPISGQIGRSSVTVGALVTANQPDALARVLQLDPIYVDLSAASTEVLRWKQDISSGRIKSNPASENVPVTINLEGEDGNDVSLVGELGFSEISVDEDAGTVNIRAVVPNKDGLILPGMFVKASFSAGSYQNVFLIPQRAVQRTPQGEPYIFIVSDDNKAEQRIVTVSGSNGSDWIVPKGLNSGDKLIVSGFQSVRDGAEVSIARTGSADPGAIAPQTPSTAE